MVKLSMNEIERTAAAVDGAVVSEGGRSPSTLSTGQRAASQGGTPPAATRPGPLAPGQRWSAGRKREVVLRLLRGEAAELLSRELAVPIYKLEQWRAKAEAALDGALKEREGEPGRVEVPVTRHLPHRSRRAAFPHRALVAGQTRPGFEAWIAPAVPARRLAASVT